MDAHRRPLMDRTLPLLTEGYAWLPDRMRDSADRVVRTRLLGRPALAVRGPDAVRFFYDEAHVHRHGAVPAPVLDTLFGQGAVHTLDGDAHRARKELFLRCSTRSGSPASPSTSPRPGTRPCTTGAGGTGWCCSTRRAWCSLAGVCRWAGLPGEAVDAEPLARDLIAMVDGFAFPGRAPAGPPRPFPAGGPDGPADRGRTSGAVTAPDGSVLERVARHRDAPDRPLDARTAAVELLNVLRPTVAVSWFVAFSAHALHRWPAHRERLRAGDGAFATAFVHEVRRFYPFAPFLGGRVVTDLTWRGASVPAGGILLLDVYGQNHDEDLWGDPYTFRPERFLDRPRAATN